MSGHLKSKGLAAGGHRHRKLVTSNELQEPAIGTRELILSFNHEARVTIVSMDSINTSEQNRPFSPLTMID